MHWSFVAEDSRISHFFEQMSRKVVRQSRMPWFPIALEVTVSDTSMVIRSFPVALMTCPPRMTLQTILMSWCAGTGTGATVPYSSMHFNGGRDIPISLETQVKDLHWACTTKYGGVHIRVSWRVITHGATLAEALEVSDRQLKKVRGSGRYLLLNASKSGHQTSNLTTALRPFWFKSIFLYMSWYNHTHVVINILTVDSFVMQLSFSTIVFC